MPATPTLRVSVAQEFSTTPGPRYKTEGDFSGEQFLAEVLFPRFQEAQAAGGTLLVDLDGTDGYATSFLDGSFGELARKLQPEEVLRVLRFKCDDEPSLIDEIEEYIREAQRG